jgi:hypothetical protein
MAAHSKLSWRLHLIARALEVNQIPITGVAYLTTEDEWQSLIKDVEEQTFIASLRGAVDITYRGITVLKPKSLA